MTRFAVLVGWVCVFMIGGCPALKDNFFVSLPRAVIKGDSVTLTCHYELFEDENLYSLKWYRQSNEFFRYTPKDNPKFKTFKLPGVDVDMDQSSGKHLVLRDVDRDTSGVYTCEVSADAPGYSTKTGSAKMEVIELPQEGPYITKTDFKSRYQLNDSVRLNCTCEKSYPAVNLTWYYDEKPVPPKYVTPKVHTVDYDYFTASSVLRFTVQSFLNQKVNSKRIKVRCVASIYERYHQSTEITIKVTRKRSGEYPYIRRFIEHDYSSTDIPEQEPKPTEEENHWDGQTYWWRIFSSGSSNSSRFSVLICCFILGMYSKR